MKRTLSVKERFQKKHMERVTIVKGNEELQDFTAAYYEMIRLYHYFEEAKKNIPHSEIVSVLRQLVSMSKLPVEKMDSREILDELRETALFTSYQNVVCNFPKCKKRMSILRKEDILQLDQNFILCSLCFTVFYCSEKHQKEDVSHKHCTNPLKASPRRSRLVIIKGQSSS